MSFLLRTGAALFLAAPCILAQPQPASPQTDVLLFVDGEKLIGRFLRSNGNSLTFHSEVAGDITVDWAKVQELYTSQRFAVIEKNVRLRRHESDGEIPQGVLEMTNQTFRLQVSPDTGPVTVPVAQAEHVIDEATLEKDVLHEPSPFAEWKGSVTAGTTLVEATQHNRTFNGAISLVRGVPPENWLPPRNRTIFDFNGAYGILTQPETPRVKTEIYHLDAEHDEYFTRDLYGFGQAAWDHNFSQGLDLEQSYGGGIGWTAIRRADYQLDVKGGVNYLRQQFQEKEEDQNLIATTFEQSLRRALARGITFQERFSISAPWNNLNAYSTGGNATLTLPVYRRISFTIGALDTFLNNPPPGFRKNSFQFTTGLTYTLP